MAIGADQYEFAPHSLQNFLISGFSVWHFGHFIFGIRYSLSLKKWDAPYSPLALLEDILDAFFQRDP